MLLRYSTDVATSSTQRILARVQPHADWLARTAEARSGCIPEWWIPQGGADSDNVTSAGWLDFNGQGGIHIQVMAELASVLPPEKSAPYVAAARQMADFLVREILPTHRWYDMETFYSCSNKPESAYDNFTNQPPRNTLSTGWAIDGLSSLYVATGNVSYLTAAQSAADYLALYQASYNPTFIERPSTAYVFGGMRSQNTDAEWLDMRQTVDAEALIRLGNLSGRQDLMERGVAALRSCFALISENRTQSNNVFPVAQVVGRQTVVPGLEPENVDHEGAPQLPGRSGPDWGEIGCLAAASFVSKRFGGAFVDAARDLCVGIDGVHLDNCSVSGGSGTNITLSFTMYSMLDSRVLPIMPWNDPFGIVLKVRGLPKSAVLVAVLKNGKQIGSFSPEALNTGVSLVVYPVDSGQ